MKILFFTYTFQDYGLDVLYDGLCQALGPENVFDYPSKDFLHGGAQNTSYPCFFDCPITKSDPEKIEMLRNGEFDAILVSCRTEKELQDQDFLRILKENNKKDTSVFIVDQSDLEGINAEMLSASNAIVYFKREYIVGKKYDSRVVPLSFSYPEKFVPANIETERANALFWAGRDYHLRRPYRTAYVRALREDLGMKIFKYAQSFYRKKLLRNTIGLSLRGYGYDTVRYWEVPAHGMLLFSERLNTLIENDFKDGETAVFFSTPEEMKDKLKYLLENKSYVDKIRISGHEWFKKYHTSSARAEQMIDKIKSHT